jgi:catechol 1,2-dioxygenase
MSAPEVATAAGSGRSATERFREKGRLTSATVDHERVSAIVTDALTALHGVVRKHDLTYDEYDAFKAWCIQVGQDGEWPLFLDVWLEYVPDAPVTAQEVTLPMREDEKGTPLLFQGTVTDLDGTPIDGALVDMWHADDEGYYSQFAPGIPEWNLRGVVRSGTDGTFRIHTIKPAPYQIPTDGSCGALIRSAGWHPWRPAHLHLKVSAPGRKLITTQLYFDGGEYIADDVAQAVKPELVLRPRPAASGTGEEVTYDFPLDPA